MAVIVTEMEIPKSCADCPLCHCKGKDDPWNYVCFVTMDDINIEEWDTDRYVTCPLKSIDGLIKEIFEKDDATRDTCGWGLEAINVVEIIKEYCEENK